MCLIAFAYKMHPVYELVLMANRDEFYSRPTRAAQFWNAEGFPELLAGKDMEGGGSWMGTTKGKRWGALTNYRDPNWKRPDPPTRGTIVLNYLTGNDTPPTFLETLKSTAGEYMGFNVLLGDPHGIYHYSNVSNKISKISSGIHGLSNALLDTPWPKLETAKQALGHKVAQDDLSPDSLFEILGNQEYADDAHLPQTGVPYEWEKAISPIFIQTETYGTRCSTLLYKKHSGEIQFIERQYKKGTQEVLKEQQFLI